MPAKMRKLKSGKVRVSTPNGVKAKATSPEKGKALVRLLNAVDHGWKPDQKEGKPMMKNTTSKKMASKGMMHKMPNGMMMSDKEMASMMGNSKGKKSVAKKGVKGRKKAAKY
jgi:hypothetical protein